MAAHCGVLATGCRTAQVGNSSVKDSSQRSMPTLTPLQTLLVISSERIPSSAFFN